MAGQKKFLNWSQDTNQNFIDDEIDEISDTVTPPVDINVDLNRCLTSSEIEAKFSDFGIIQHVGKFVSFVAIKGIDILDIPGLAADPDVAVVELQPTFEAGLDVSTRAIRARASNTFSPQTVQNLGFTGQGVNIAILDTGVDNGHETFAGKTVRGFNAITNVEVDPDDDNNQSLNQSLCVPNPVFHGTHVAGIALGNGRIGRVCRNPGDGSPTSCTGAAPGAGLVDIKVLDNCGSGNSVTTIRGIDKAIERQAAWGIGVMNLSIWSRLFNGDGRDAESETVNTAVARGIVTTVIAGNGFGMIDPITGLPLFRSGFGAIAAASQAITVANSNDQNTVGRGNDTVAGSSNRGPRSTDNDEDPLDELKPDIAAPGSGIMSAQGDAGNGATNQYQPLSGTSMAAPHVAGVAALILEAKPFINPGSVKELLKQTAETAPAIPAMDSNRMPDSALDLRYDIGSGNGLVNAFAAVRAAAVTDVKFPSCIDGGSPCLLSPDNASPPNWLNTVDITLATDPPVAGTPNQIRVKVTNTGANIARGVRINVGVYRFTAGTSRFFELGSRVIDIPAGSTVTVTQVWTPEVGHRCIQATIDYGLDSNFTNNVTQRNIDVKTTSSPAVFTFDVENSLTVPATIELETLSDNPKWTCSLDQTSFSLDPFTDCPRTVTATLNPVIELVELVSATHPAIPPATNGRTLLGGVSVRATDETLGTATCHIFAFAVTPQPLCFGVPATIVGTPGNDVLHGTLGDDVIVGLGGNDAIAGKGGNDLICGNEGNDIISGDLGDDKIDAGAGDDAIDGGRAMIRSLEAAEETRLLARTATIILTAGWTATGSMVGRAPTGA